MRQKKAMINSIVNLVTFMAIFLPNLIVRKVFLDTLGEDLLGLNSLYTNIIGWLSIVELGVGTAIIFSLYKPFADNDYPRVRAYLKFYQKFYVTVGFAVLIVGLLLTPFLQVFLENQSIDMTLVRVGFVLYLVNSFITYLFSSRLCILNVAQEGYKVSIGTTSAKLLIFITQLIILKIYPNFLLFSGVQIIINLLFYFIINRYILNYFPWIKAGKEELEDAERKNLLVVVKAMFMHKFGSLIVFSTDNLVISKFVGLASLAQYTNYQTVTLAVEKLVSTAMQGITSSIGNMLTECDSDHASKIHNKIFFLNFWITSFITISLYNTLDQFVGLWVGEEYILDNLTFIVLLINFYFVLMRGSVERFKEASGNYVQDRYAPLAEGLINLISSLILVKHIGLAGVFVGTMISNFTVLFWVQPYIVYKYVFQEKVINYFKMYFTYAALMIALICITHYLTIPFKYNYTILSFLINCFINITVVNSVYLLLFRNKDELNYFINIIKRVLKK